MKKNVILLSTAILSACVLGGSQIVQAAAPNASDVQQLSDDDDTDESSSEDEEDATGTFDDVTWTLDSEGTLKLSAGTLTQGGLGQDAAFMTEHGSSVENIEIDGEIILPADSSKLFAGFTNLESIDGLDKLDTSAVTDMSGMFQNDKAITDLDLTSFDTSAVVSLNQMFDGADALVSVDLDGWDTSKVESMAGIFNNNPKLGSLKLDKTFTPTEDAADLGLSKKVWIQTGTDASKDVLKVADWLKQDDRNDWIIKTAYTGSFTATIPNNIDDKLTVDIPEADQPAYIGQTVKVAVPKKDGYTADKETITFKATADGLVTDEKVTYTSTDEDGDGIVNAKNYLTVHPGSESATLIDSSGNDVANRGLAGNSSWYSDKVMTLKGVKYYRVASNEWISEDSIYLYESIDAKVKTKDTEFTTLVDSEGNTVKNRGLAKDTEWRTDKKATIKGKVYYRVATNEFISPDDITISK